MVEGYGRYSGLDRYEARKLIVADLEEQGFLVKVEDHQHNVGTCYRCHNDVEPLISAQWFVKMEPLAREALRVVNDGEVTAVNYCSRKIPKTQPQRHIIVGVKMAVQSIILECHRKMTVTGKDVVDQFFAQIDASGCDIFQTADHAQDG